MLHYFRRGLYVFQHTFRGIERTNIVTPMCRRGQFSPDRFNQSIAKSFSQVDI